MARTKRKQKVSFKGYQEFRFTGHYKDLANEWLKNANDIDQIVEDLIEAGHKVSVAALPNGSGYTASAYANDSDNVNAGYSMTVRHAEVGKSLKLLDFVVSEVYDNGKWAELTEEDLSW